MGYYSIRASFESSSHYWEEWWSERYDELKDAENALAIKRFQLEEQCECGNGPENASFITLYIMYNEEDQKAVKINKRTIDVRAAERGES